MLAFVANTTASWESLMHTTDDREKGRVPVLPAVTESVASTRLANERGLLVGPSRHQKTYGAAADSRSRFLTVLLRALSAWPA